MAIQTIIHLEVFYYYGTDRGIQARETSRKVDVSCDGELFYGNDNWSCSISESQLSGHLDIEKDSLGWRGECWCTPETREKREHELRSKMWDVVLVEMERLRVLNNELELSIAHMEKHMELEDFDYDA